MFVIFISKSEHKRGEEFQWKCRGVAEGFIREREENRCGSMFEGDFFERIRKMVEEMERKTEERALEVREAGKGAQVKVRRRTPLETDREVKETLETEYVYVERPWEVLFCMRVPGVNREGVEVRRRGRAMEIVARREDGRAYFGTFELPPKAVPEERVLKLRGGFLLLIVPKRRRS
jgi:HSP20 family molecular chaperone IbpA